MMPAQTRLERRHKLACSANSAEFSCFTHVLTKSGFDTTAGMQEVEQRRSSCRGCRLVLYSKLGRGPTHLKPGGFSLRMSERFWSIGGNRRIVAAAMRARKPIGDSHVHEAGRLIRATKGTVLSEERTQLRKARWRYNSKSREWRPPRRNTCTGSRIPRSSC